MGWYSLDMTKSINKACDRMAIKYNLSGAERHIAYLISTGHTPKEIAEIRARSLDTVRTQIKSLMQKVGVQRVSNLVVEVCCYIEKT